MSIRFFLKIFESYDAYITGQPVASIKYVVSGLMLSGIISHFSGTYIDDLDAPIPGDPCLTGLFVIANSPK